MASEEHLIAAQELYGYDRRTGVGISPEQNSVEEGLIYSARFLAIKPEVALYAEVLLPDDASASILPTLDSLPWGGEGRRVLVEEVAPFAWPQPVARDGAVPW